MTRWILGLSLAALGMCQGMVLADCPSGYPNEIFCDSFDTYCTGGGFPGSADCAAGPGDNTLLRTVWQNTSVNDSTGLACGSQFTVDMDPLYLSSLLFGGRQPTLPNDPIGQQTVSNWNVTPAVPGLSFRIQNTFPGFDSVGVPPGAPPLVLEFYLSGVNKPEFPIGGGLSRSTAYLELAMGNDRANTDYAETQYCGTYCNPPIGQGPYPMLCAIGNPIEGPISADCPTAATAPVHAALAIGTMPMLDTNPCHCGVQEHGPINWHLSFYDGKLWWYLKLNSPLASTGTIEAEDPNAPMPPPADVNSPGDFVLQAGREGGAGPSNQWVTLTIKTSTVDVKMVGRGLSGNGYIYRTISIMNDIPRQYFGPFDQLRAGLGAGCKLASSSSWTDNCVAGGRHCITTLKPNANAVIFDDVVLHGGAGYSVNGACCLDNASCVDNESQEHCEAEAPAGLGGRWQTSGTSCATTSCCPYPFADGDHDADVDQDDFGIFQLCYAGAGGGVPTGCACLDRNADNAIDNNDFIAFKNCYTGANVPWSASLTPTCTP